MRHTVWFSTSVLGFGYWLMNHVIYPQNDNYIFAQNDDFFQT